MKIGITGATGLIGSAVGRLAAQKGHAVVAYTRSPQRFSLPWASEVRALDVKAERPLDVAGLDALVHLAGESILGYWTAAKMERIRSTRVELTRKIAQVVANTADGPKALLSGSGTGFYGDRGDEVLTEAATAGTDFLASVCVEWEAAARLAEGEDRRVVLLRTSLVMAKEGGAWPLMKRAFGLGAGGTLGDGSHWMPWIHLDDEAGMILWAAENEAVRGPLNLAAPGALTNREFTKIVGSVLKRPTILPAPKFALRLVLRQLADAITASQRAVPQASLAGGYEFKYPELASAIRNLMARS
jgi:uncharacterized protein